MANYYGVGRTNYFKVKNKEKFLKWAAEIPEIRVHEGSRKNEYCILMESECGCMPIEKDIGNPETEFDFLRELSRFLSKHSVAIFVHAGNETLRYICGHATAINSKGEFKIVELESIYAAARDLTDKPNSVTRAVC